jgi:hypothetical protein
MKLRIGDKGPEVGKLQEDLARLGFYHGRVDRDFGRITESALKEFQRRKFVTGVADTKTIEAISWDVATPRPAMAPPKRPQGIKEVSEVFGNIEYVDVDGGRIKIVNGWTDESIRSVTLPVIGKEQVHRLLVDVFFEVLIQAQNQGLAEEIRQFAVWSPRHKMHDSGRPLSLHSWGIACDINWSENPPGHASRIHPGIVSLFETAGFYWGANFSHPDPMHFQFATGC